MANQYGRKSFDKVTLTLDPNDPLTLQYIQGIESKLRSTIRSAQDEGDPIRRTPRALDDAGMMRTDFYVPQGMGPTLQNVYHDVNANVMGLHKRGLAGRMTVAENVGMRTQTAMINDKAARARIMKTVQERGGMARTLDSGMTQLEIPMDAQVLGSAGKPAQLTRSISSQIASSNRKSAAGLSSFLSDAGYEDKTVAEQRSIERMAAGKMSGKDVFYARQKSRSRKAALMERYEKDNPDDPLVKRRRESRLRATKKKQAAAVKGGVSLVARMVTGIITSILSGIMLGIGVLKAIKDAVLDIGGRLRKTSLSEMQFNFSDNTLLGWERFASAKGLNEKSLVGAAASLQANWIDPLHYKGAAFDAVAPYFKDKTELFTQRAQAGGEQNMLGMMGDVLDVAMSNITAGRWGTKEGLTQGEAAEGWIRTFGEAFGSDMQEILKAMYADYTSEARPGGYSTWTETTTEDGETKQIRMTGMRYLTQAQWNDMYKMLSPEGLGIADDVDRANFEEARLAIAKFASLLKSITTDTLSTFGLKLKTLSDVIQTNLINLLVKIAPERFAGLAAAKTEEAIIQNEKSSLFIQSTEQATKDRAESVLRAAGVSGDIDEVVKGLMTGDYAALTPKQRAKISERDMATLAAHGALLEGKDALSDARHKAGKGKVPNAVEVDALSIEQRTKEALLKLRAQAREAAKEDIRNIANKAAGGSIDGFSIDGFIDYKELAAMLATTHMFELESGEIDTKEYMKRTNANIEKLKNNRWFKKIKDPAEQRDIIASHMELQYVALLMAGDTEGAQNLRSELIKHKTGHRAPGRERNMAELEYGKHLDVLQAATAPAGMSFGDIASASARYGQATKIESSLILADAIVGRDKPRMRYMEKDAYGNPVKVDKALPNVSDWLAEGNNVLFDVDDIGGNSTLYIKFQQLDEKGQVIRSFDVANMSNTGYKGDLVIDANSAQGIVSKVDTQ